MQVSKHTSVFGAMIAAITLLMTPIGVFGQTITLTSGEDEECLFAMSQKGQQLATPAEPAEMIVLQRTELSRIVTLHKSCDLSAGKATITLYNVNSEYNVGVWEAVVEPVPGKEDLFYWKVNPGKAIHPGRYQIIVSNPESWLNTSASGKQGLVWVFNKKQLSL